MSNTIAAPRLSVSLGSVMSADLNALKSLFALVPLLWTAATLAADSTNFSSRADEYLTKLREKRSLAELR
jgi:hypothetical protein